MAIKEVGQSADSIIGIQVDQTAPTNTQVLAYNSTSKKWVSTTPSSGGASLAFKTVAVSGQSDVVADGSTDTLTLAEGSNVTITTTAGTDTVTIAAADTNTQLTQEQVEDFVNGVCVGGTNITITYDDAAGTLTFVGADTNTQLTQEQVEDYVNGVIVGGTNITATYDDAAGTLTLVGADTNTQTESFKTISVSGQDDVVADSSTDTLTLAAGSNITITTTAGSDTVTIASADTNTQLTQEQVEDYVNGVIVGGTNITATYDDAAGTLTLVGADTNTQLTQEQVEDYVNGVIVGGTNITATYDDAAGTLTLVGTDTNTQLTQEQVEDYVNGVIVGGTNITATYDDAAGTLTLVGADTNTQLTQEQVEDFVDGLIVAGSNITKTYDDAAGTLTIAASGGSLTGVDDQSSSNDDQITITDSAVIINEDSDDLDFRVESDGATHALFCEGSSGNVGLNTDTTNEKLTVDGVVSLAAQTSITATDGFAKIYAEEVVDTNTVLLLHMNGADDGTTFTDSSTTPHTVTPTNAVTKTGTKKFGTASGFFDGTGDKLEIPDSSDFSFPGEFTVEFWVKFNAPNTGGSSGNGHQCVFRDSGGGAGSYRVQWTGLFYTNYNSTTDGWEWSYGAAYTRQMFADAISDTDWHHVAFTRDSSNLIKCFRDGQQKGSDFSNATSYDLDGLLRIGTNNGNDELNAYLDDFRITKGAARYDASFTPPTQAFSGTGRVALPETKIVQIGTGVALDVLHNPTTLDGDTGGGESVTFGTGTTVAGKMYYLNSSGAWTLTDANAVASGASQLLAIALGTAPGTHGMLIRGFFDVATYLTGTFVQGAAVYVSETTAGTIDVAAPASSGDFIRIVGHATDLANVVYFNPSGDWVEL